MAAVLRKAESLLDAQTSRGLIAVSALLKIANHLAAPDLAAALGDGTSPEAAAAEELRALQADLKQHTNSVLDAMWHIRNLPKCWQDLR